jgi:V8-like Glu-specific endopeptidase
LLGVSAALVLSSCASGAGKSEPTAAETSEVISADGILFCPVEGTTPDPWFSVTAMNNKLRNYPEFARASGLTEVKSCADAWAFSKKYGEYQVASPYFDLDEPFEDPNYPEPEAPSLTEEDIRAAEGTGPKIRNGSGDQLSPVVRLYINKNDNKGELYHYCTGTFIARNWIITAAHCMQAKPGYDFGTSDPSKYALNGYYPYNIEFYGPQGKLVRRQRFSIVRQYMDPRYTGNVPGNPYKAHDFALLYVDKQFDGWLPNTDPASTSTSSTFPFMRVSMADHIFNVSGATFWGAGLIDHDTLVTSPTGEVTQVATEAGVADSRLRRGSLLPYQTSFGLKPEPEQFTTYLNPDGTWGSAPAPRSIYGKIFYDAYANASAAETCHGDSGGPLIEPWVIKDPSGNSVTAYVEVGVLSEHIFALDTPCATDAACSSISPVARCAMSLHRCFDLAKECQDKPGDGAGWTPTTYEREFIQAIIPKWYKSNFRCTVGSRVDANSGGNTADDYLQCWGKPCLRTAPLDANDKDACSATETCYRPGSELAKNCLACAGGGCGCYYGQCLPKKKK